MPKRIKKGRILTESIEDVNETDILEDIAALARKLAEKEPFQSASGPEALRAFATHLEQMLTSFGRAAPAVAFRIRRKKSG